MTAHAVALDPDILLKRLEREKRARLTAEAVIEEKSAALFKVNQELEVQLSASVKVLADVLAMARPEVFQKAGKVQRWANRLIPHLNVERRWELDLVTMLYPLGMLSLPDDLAMKKSLNMPLTDKERETVEESTHAAYRLLRNFPRMEPVATAVLYSNKGFDGSGFPNDDVKGHQIPQSARILKILTDLSDDATGVGRKRDFHSLIARKHLYDLDILKIAYQHLRRVDDEPESEGQILIIDANLLTPGDIAHKDIVDIKDGLVLAAGAIFSDLTIRRLREYCKGGRVKGPFAVIRDAKAEAG